MADGQMVLQEPQLFTFERISVSQPAVELQSANPELQLKSQETPLQKAIAFGGLGQLFKQDPQLRVVFRLTH